LTFLTRPIITVNKDGIISKTRSTLGYSQHKLWTPAACTDLWGGPPLGVRQVDPKNVWSSTNSWCRAAYFELLRHEARRWVNNITLKAQNRAVSYWYLHSSVH